jgi:hypothetical protein
LVESIRENHVGDVQRTPILLWHTIGVLLNNGNYLISDVTELQDELLSLHKQIITILGLSSVVIKGAFRLNFNLVAQDQFRLEELDRFERPQQLP